MEIAALYDIYRRNPVISTDSRNITRDSIFIALSGQNFDGNKFAVEALRNGAAYVMVSDPSLTGENFIHVPDTLATLQSLANYHRHHYNIPFIAITGSNGKTTTKELISTALSRKYRVHATDGNFNNHIGVPLTILAMPPDVEIAVIEMGANHIGEINSLCEIAMPTHGIITNIGRAHLEGFGSIEGVQIAKGELFDYLKNHNGYVFYNTDDPRLAELGKDITDKTTYGFDPNENPSILFNYSSNAAMGGFTITDEKRNVVIQSSMFGFYNAINMLAAYAVGLHFEVEKESIVESLSAFTPGSNRSETISFSGCTVIKDAYNANPSSMELAVKAFAERYDCGWVILGDMKELGPESENAHGHLIDVVTSLGFNQIVLIGKEFKAALLKKYIPSTAHIMTADTIEDLKAKWSWEALRGNAILLKGSRSMHLEKLLED